MSEAEGYQPEFSERARYVTEQVSLWVSNDSDHYFTAREWAGKDAGTGSNGLLASYLTGVIRGARPGSAPWYVRQELASNDFDRIHWADIADDLLSE